MANNGTGTVEAAILNDLSRMSLSGALSFAPRDANDLWFYSEMIYDSASDPLI